jgi:hypothetical protein
MVPPNGTQTRWGGAQICDRNGRRERGRAGGTGRDALGYSDVVSGYSLADILCADGAAQERSQAISTVVSIAPAAGVKSTPDPSLRVGPGVAG